MSGELRRPPQLWEQRLARTTSIFGVGVTGGDTTSLVTPAPPPGSGGGTDDGPTLPPPGDFIKPSTPTLLGAVQGIRVSWDGLNSAGDLWPYDTAWVDVHMSTAGTGFTVGTATLQGRLARPGGLYVGGLTAGTTYYFRLQGVDPAGNVTAASDAASGQTGLTTSSDYGTATIGSGAVSFDARAIGGVASTVGSVAPTNPLEGDIWLDNSALTASIATISASGSALTVTTTAAHGLGQTDAIAISGVNNTTTRTVSNAVGNGSQVTYTTTVAHGFAAGQSVTVSSVNPSTYNRTGTIVSTTSTTFVIAAPATGAYVSGGQAVASTNSFNISGTVASVPSDTSFTVSSSLTGTYVSGGTIVGPVKGLRYRRYDGTTWVLQPWGPEALSAKSITSLQLTTGAITAGAIAAGAITADKIQAGAVTTDKLTAGTISGFYISGGTINGGYINGGTVDAGYINGGTVNAAVYTGGSISSSTFTGGTISGSITATGTVSGAVLTGGSISGGYITGGTVEATAYIGGSITQSIFTGGTIAGNITATGTVTGGVVSGAVVQSAATGKRVSMDASANELQFFDASGTKTADLASVTVRSTNGLSVTGALDVSSLCDISTDLYVGDDVFITGDLEVDGALSNTSTSVPNVRINTTSGEIKQTTHVNSAQRFKHDIIPLDNTPFGGAVDLSLLGDPNDQAVDPVDILHLTPIQYRRNEAPEVVVTGFLAEDVEHKFPTAATYDDDGVLETIDERAIVAALLGVVKQQQSSIEHLRARIEALEA